MRKNLVNEVRAISKRSLNKIRGERAKQKARFLNFREELSHELAIKFQKEIAEKIKKAAEGGKRFIDIEASQTGGNPSKESKEYANLKYKLLANIARKQGFRVRTLGCKSIIDRSGGYDPAGISEDAIIHYGYFLKISW